MKPILIIICRDTNPSFIILEFNGDNIGAFVYEYVNEKVVITKGSLKDLGEKEQS